MILFVHFELVIFINLHLFALSFIPLILFGSFRHPLLLFLFLLLAFLLRFMFLLPLILREGLNHGEVVILRVMQELEEAVHWDDQLVILLLLDLGERNGLRRPLNSIRIVVAVVIFVFILAFFLIIHCFIVLVCRFLGLIHSSPCIALLLFGFVGTILSFFLLLSVSTLTSFITMEHCMLLGLGRSLHIVLRHFLLPLSFFDT